MTPFLQLIFVLTIILFASKLAGYLTTKIGQPAVLGELLVGLLLGPSLIDLTHLVFITDRHLGEVVAEFGEIGVLVLMFLAGLELHFSELTRNTRVAAFSGILGVLTPVGLGLLAGRLFGYSFPNAAFIGLTLGATSVSISAQTLMELKVLRSRVGLGLLGAAVFDDILVILLLSTFLALSGGGSAFDILIVFVKMIGFLSLSAAFGLWVLPRLSRRVSTMPVSQGMLTFSLIIMMIYGLAAELIGGMAAITGTFLAGLMFARTPEKNQIEPGLRSLAYSFFVPIFFVNIGLSVDTHTLNLNAFWLMLVISTFAILGKVIGCGLGAKLGGFNWLESLQLGIGMISRGEVGLIVASIGLAEGYINETVFSAIVGMVLITTLLTPPLLRASFKTATAYSTAPAQE
ncbi:MAG: cation:proton antiporter [Chloroflexota bacterium]